MISTPELPHPSTTPPPPSLVVATKSEVKVELSNSVTVIPPTPPAAQHVPPKPVSPSDINMQGSMSSGGSRSGRLTASAMINYDKKKKQAEMG